MGFCIPMMRDGGTGFEPSMDVYYYHFNEKNKLFSDSYEIEPLVQLVRSPRHGVLTTDRHKKDVDSWFYTPEKGYLGNDQAEFLVEVEDVLVRLVYIFRVTNLNPDSDSGEALGVCKKSQWIISQPSLEASVAPIPLS
ncbi:hypothetical protein AGMMS50289_17680 [Betaproteobacteria bacterium]|nr:hypothetical protein AGMMS50289_17680 [Betaproteobacteria bacterium]